MTSPAHELDRTADSAILNISTYKFVSLDDLPRRKQELKSLAESLSLKGTILLSPEGINMFLAGDPDKIHAFFQELHCDPLFSDIQPKESLSSDRPFRRMLVRIKKEIIAFGIDEVIPEKKTSPKLPARELKKWLDEGRPIRLLDVRNDYEIQLGTFDNAEELGIRHFRDFPTAIQKLPVEAKQQPLVMFCTGGIRCEKAGPLMEQAGFNHVYQLDGGILKYFEEVGGDHWNGSCFVFDNRVALAPNLQPTGDQLCFACQAVLSPQQLASPLYRLGVHCPNCYRSPEDLAIQQREQRQEKIRQIATAQLGSQPYDNVRKIHVPRRMAGATVIEFLKEYQPTIGELQWREWLDRNEITFFGRPVTADETVREGQEFVQHQPNTIEPKISPNIELLYEDEMLAVVNKPAPLPTHPSGRFNRNTLTSILEKAYPQQKLRVAHRLDANTSGVVVLCRKAQASRFVQPQFASGQIQKVYYARVYGRPSWNEYTCQAEIGSEISDGGSRQILDKCDDQNCVTTFQVVEAFGDGTSLILARPLTGRTHQIRIHLWHLGFPIVGDPLYLKQNQLGQNITLSVDDSPMCLHAHQLTLTHPSTGKSVTYSAPLPPWAIGEKLKALGDPM